VEGAGLDTTRTQQAQPGAHLAGGAGRERHRQHLGRGIDAARHAIGDPMGDRPGLAGARTGQHPHRPAERLGDQPLLGIQRGEQVVGSGQREQLRGRDG
jgi:hypothetical protein